MNNREPGIEKLTPQERPDGTPSPQVSEGGKREFVEPTISVPVDVLEATTFFQEVDSGAV